MVVANKTDLVRGSQAASRLAQRLPCDSGLPGVDTLALLHQQNASFAWPALLQAEQREVSTDVGVQFARAHGCLFVETSAKGNVAVEQAFEELVLKVGKCSIAVVWVWDEERGGKELYCTSPSRACGDHGAATVFISGSGRVQPCPDMHLCPSPTHLPAPLAPPLPDPGDAQPAGQQQQHLWAQG